MTSHIIQESDLDYISITEDGNTSDITINYSSDTSSIGTIIYDQNLHDDCDQVNTPWGKNCQHSTVTNSKVPHLELLYYGEL